MRLIHMLRLSKRRYNRPWARKSRYVSKRDRFYAYKGGEILPRTQAASVQKRSPHKSGGGTG
nr:hypothetical protein [uncultured Campylobacter sp.]